MISPSTVLEILDFTKEHYESCDYALDIDGDIVDFIAEHVKRGCFTFSRGDNGRIRAVLFGWPVDMDVAVESDGENDGLQAVVSSECLYVNMLVVDPGISKRQAVASILSLATRVQERWGCDITHVAYHRAKYGNRFKVSKFNAKELV